VTQRRAWWTKGRTCFNANGARKAAFATKRAAEKAIPKAAKGLAAYRCPEHGWHLGH
jgi:hypothetical protein